MRVLNIGAGKVDQSRFSANILTIHVDKYFDELYSNNLAETVQGYIDSLDKNAKIGHQIMCRSDIFEFVDKFPFKFDLIIAERIFEHLEYVSGEIGRLLEALNILSNRNAKLQIIVPNAVSLAKMLLDYETNNKSYSHIQSINTKLILNTEYNNIKQDPHLSIWTPKLAEEYILSEGTWLIEQIVEKYKFANRDIYMQIICKKG